jgi:hypothetical protein
MAFKEEEIGNNSEKGVKYLSLSKFKPKLTRTKISHHSTNHKMHSFRNFGH